MLFYCRNLGGKLGINSQFIKRLFICLLFFVLITPLVFSQHFDMILADDPILEDLRLLSLEARKPFLSFSPPLAPGEIRKFTDSLDTEKLSANGREAYSRIQNRLTPSSNISYTDELFSVLFIPNTTLEGRVRFNPNIEWYPRYYQSPSFFSAALNASFANTAQLYFEPILTDNTSGKANDNFTSNIIYISNAPIHNVYFLRAFGAAGGSWWNFQLGRDRLFWGTGHTGSLTFADNSPYFDFARFSLFSSTVKYSVLVNQLPIRLSPALFADEWLNANLESIDTKHTTLQRYFYLHRIDIKVFDKISIGLMEGVMIGDSPFEIRYLNPLMVFHTLFAWNDFPKWQPNNGDMVGSFASVELNWNVFSNFSFYGQFVMNEFTLPGETDEQPDALGFMAGAQYSFSFNNWAAITYLEFIYTDPYLHILSSPFASFIQMDRASNYYFIGYPRDTMAVTFGVNMFNNKTLHFLSRFSWLASGQHTVNRGTNGLTWNWEKGPEAMAERSPTSTVENKFVLSLTSSWNPYTWLSLKATIEGIVSLNNNHIPNNKQIGGQSSFSVGFKY